VPGTRRHQSGDRGRLAITVTPAGGAELVVLDGELTGATTTALAGSLTGLLRDADVVVVDLTALRFTHPAQLGLFTAVLDEAGGWPAAKLALVTRDRFTRHALHTGGAARLLPVSDDVGHAAHRAHRRPAHVRARWSLPAERTTPLRARHLVRLRLAAWEWCPAPDRELVVTAANELVINAVLHARTRLHVDLDLVRERLRVAVRDHAPLPRDERERLDGPRPGRGLDIVDALATDWGVVHRDDGKTLWAGFDGWEAPR
jgi:hypothetical protein